MEGASSYEATIYDAESTPLVSQDGHFTVFAWSPCEAMVHAHRVDVLLL